MTLDGIELDIGMPVYDLVYGAGVIRNAMETELQVQFPSVSSVVIYDDGGKFHYAQPCNRTLYLDEVKIDPPPKPKRKVKKEFVGYVDVRDFAEWSDNPGRQCTLLWKTPLDYSVPVTGTVEVEE